MKIDRRQILKLFAGAIGVAAVGPMAMASKKRPLLERLKGSYDPDLMWPHSEPLLELVPLEEETQVLQEACYHEGKFYFPQAWVYEKKIPPKYHQAFLDYHQIPMGSELDLAMYSNPALLAIGKRWILERRS